VAGLTAEGFGDGQALRALVEAESADLAERRSLRWMWNEMEYEGHYFGDAPVGGYRRLAEAMATGVDLRLGVDVAEVACSASGVRDGSSASPASASARSRPPRGRDVSGPSRNDKTSAIPESPGRLPAARRQAVSPRQIAPSQTGNPMSWPPGA